MVKRQSQRATLKALKGSEVGDKPKKKLGLIGLSADKCDNCDEYLAMIQKHEQQLDEQDREIALLKK